MSLFYLFTVYLLYVNKEFPYCSMSEHFLILFDGNDDIFIEFPRHHAHVDRQTVENADT
jgi:hypothetical protein